MDTDSLRFFLIKHNLDAATLYYLLEQGIEVERIRLQMLQCTKAPSIESHVKIIQGERILSLLTAIGLG